MQFLKDFLRNLAILLVIGLVLFVISPTMMTQVFQIYGAIFGPLSIALLVVFALPRKRDKYRSRR
jgi:hypothetical protein